MADTTLSTLKATRISEAAAKVNAAQQKVAEVEKRLTDLERNPLSSTPEQFAAGQNDLATAREVLTFENNQLEAVLGTSRPARFIEPVIFQYIVFGLLALIVLGFLMYGIASNALLPSLSSISTSRGLITFLVAVVTVTIALILLLATVVSDSPDQARRFTQGKEVLTALIGVLGTIVGFYFGHTTEATTALEIAPPYVNSMNPTGGDKISIVTFASGGKAPYSYDVVFSPEDILPAITAVQSPDGAIRILDHATPPVKADTKLSFRIQVRDSEGRSGMYDSSLAGKDLNLKPPSKK